MTELTTPITEKPADLLPLEKPSILAEKKPEPALQEFYRFQAYHLAEALKLKGVAKLFDLKPMVLNPNRLIYEFSPNGYCLFFNFGSVVFFNLPESLQKIIFEKLRGMAPTAADPKMGDSFLMEVEKKGKNTVTFDRVQVDRLNRDRVEIIALVLAQSIALEFFENRVENILNKLGNIAFRLETRRVKDPSGKAIREFIGQTMSTKQNLITTLYLLEKPEETWESKVLDDLHQEAAMMFELKERFRALDYKLQTIQENMTLLANFAVNRQMVLLEAAIVGLFILDIILVGYELFLK